MTRRRVVIAEFMDEAAVAALATAHDTLYDPGLADRDADLKSACTDVEALIVRNRTQVTRALVCGAPRNASKQVWCQSPSRRAPLPAGTRTCASAASST